jgi:hypothetical protein
LSQERHTHVSPSVCIIEPHSSQNCICRRNTRLSDICVNFRSVVDSRQLLMHSMLNYRRSNRQCLILPDIVFRVYFVLAESDSSDSRCATCCIRALYSAGLL